MDEYPYSDNYGMNLSGLPITGAVEQDHISFNQDWKDMPNSLDKIFQYNMTMKEHTGEFNLNKTTLISSESQNHLWKYNEDKILKDIQDYVTTTYKSHYCGSDNNYRDIQTIDLMAAKQLAANFCQANILKYGSRYGQKDGRNKIDLLKVIHYAMLLLHFDGHYSRKDNGLTEFR
jgi:hypothetical protein